LPSASSNVLLYKCPLGVLCSGSEVDIVISQDQEQLQQWIERGVPAPGFEERGGRV